MIRKCIFIKQTKITPPEYFVYDNIKEKRFGCNFYFNNQRIKCIFFEKNCAAAVCKCGNGLFISKDDHEHLMKYYTETDDGGCYYYTGCGDDVPAPPTCDKLVEFHSTSMDDIDNVINAR